AVLEDLVNQAIHDKTASILEADMAMDSKFIADDQLEDLFGISMDDFDLPTIVKDKAKGLRPATQKSPKEPITTTPRDSLQSHLTDTALVAACISDSKSNLSIKDLQKATGFPARKLYGVLSRLKQQGRVLNPAQGIYSRISES
ncbi:MAG: hypothetical protein KKA76_05290, partial [Proteobacteria bacterium]|nr:hypothetical protein [Pseudomonadota bacterium]